MADEGVISATTTELGRHPYLIIGGVVAVVALLYVASSARKTPAAPQNFSFSYGPSDAQVLAGTAQQIATQQGQTAVSLANIQATTSTAEAGDYFNYLTNNSANSLTAALAGDTAAVGINSNNNATSVTNTAALVAGQVSANATTVAGQVSANATTVAGNVQMNANNNGTAQQGNSLSYQAILSNNGTALSIAQQNQLTASQFNTIQSQLSGLSTSVGTNAAYSGQLGGLVSNLWGQVAGNTSAIASNTSAISGVNGSVASLASSVGGNQATDAGFLNSIIGALRSLDPNLFGQGQTVPG